VDLPRYYISRYETSVAQFAAYLNAIGEEAGRSAADWPADLPVTYITWPEALAYTRWLDAQLRESANTPAELKSFLEAGGRVTLPSEAEWEKAARGTEGQVFPWRNVAAEEVANFNGSRHEAVNAMNCQVCAWGLSDMSGNVWEMTASPMQPYPFSDAGRH
jgi:formylglycine-generating enzyme required for sulfatase activity